MTFSRADHSQLANWWFTVDRSMLAALMLLIAAGMVLSLAASPAVAVRKGYSAFHFAERHFVLASVGVVVMLAVSVLSPRLVRRLALVLFAVSIALLIGVALMGPEINGAKRWIRLGTHSFQPSELAKPSFIILSAWLLAEARKRQDVPAATLAIGLYGLLAGLLVIQPDVGQTILITVVWGVMFFLSGQSLKLAAVFALAGVVGFAGAYASFDHVRSRVARFLDPSSGDTFQTQRAVQSFIEGGFFGRGPGEGTIKSVLPDAHTDFIAAVIGEEYGIITCLVLLGLFAFVLAKAIGRASREPDLFIRLGIIGLALAFSLQALIHMGVNVGLLPAKGMTLPFVSAGGSSSLAISVTVGMLLALMRRRPDAAYVKKPQLRPSLG